MQQLMAAIRTQPPGPPTPPPVPTASREGDVIKGGHVGARGPAPSRPPSGHGGGTGPWGD